MTATEDNIDIEKIEKDLFFLTGCLQEMLIEAGEGELSSLLDGLSRVTTVPQKAVPLYSLFFLLNNLVEENAAAQYRRKLETAYGFSHLSGLWGKVLLSLLREGVSAEEIAGCLAHVTVEPVLTAHPTEAKRQTVLDHLRTLYLLLVKRENTLWTRFEQAGIREEVKAVLERLWFTNEIFLEKPMVSDELRNVIHYLTHVFPDTIEMVDNRLKLAWKENKLDPTLIDGPSRRPSIHFGNWVGGDRDGHPLVTAKITEDALHRLRGEALTLIKNNVLTLLGRLSISDKYHAVPASLREWIASSVRAIGSEAHIVFERNQCEPWRQAMRIISLKIPVGADGRIVKALQPWHYANSESLLADLYFIYQTLCESHSKRIAEQDLEPLIRKVATFGFQLARIDVRENSSFHDKAIAQVLFATGVAEMDFASWDYARRLEFFNSTLSTEQPLLKTEAGLGEEAQKVLASYRVLAHHIDQFGTEGVGSLIVSMTRDVTDLLAVYFLAREAGLIVKTENGLACIVAVVPLFETVDDLKNSAQVTEQFLGNAITIHSLAYRQDKALAAVPLQQVMLGYSDSNKDEGIISSLWNLHKAGEKLVEVGARNDTRIGFFHGRGGTVSRGGGPTHRFIDALPSGSVNGYLRLTEQGEVISQKYANKVTAAYNLELLTAGALGATLKQKKTVHLDPIHECMNFISEKSGTYYRALMNKEGFLAFFYEATPIDVVEESRIGSRPARRRGIRDIDSLRAIPWVFSWAQARFCLTGWFGAGYAFEALYNEMPNGFEVLYKGSQSFAPLRNILTNLTSSLMVADREIMAHYATLVTDTPLKNSILPILFTEFERTIQYLELFYGQSLKERRPRTKKMMDIRKSKLDTLHQIQIEELARWRQLKRSGESKEADGLLNELLLSLNAIAGGLRATG